MILDHAKPRKAWFKPPTGPQILRQHRALRLNDYPSDSQVVEAVMNLSPDQALIIPQTYRLPKEIITSRGVPIEEPTAAKYKRYGQNVQISRAQTVEQALQLNLDSQKAVYAAFNRVTLDGNYRGYSWWGLRTRIHKIVPLISIIDGYEIYHVFEEMPELFSDTGIPRERIDVDTYRSYAYVTVPSRTKPGHKYKLTFSNIPSVDNKLDWHELSVEADVEDKIFNQITYRYAIGDVVTLEMRFTDHAVTGFRRLVAVRSVSDMPVGRTPIVHPSPELIGFNDSLRYRTVVERRRNRYISFENLNEAEREALNWKFAGYLNRRARREGTQQYAADFLCADDYGRVRDKLVTVV